MGDLPADLSESKGVIIVVRSELQLWPLFNIMHASFYTFEDQSYFSSITKFSYIYIYHVA